VSVARFEDLRVWQKAMRLCVAVYRATRTGLFARDFGLRDQIQRAAVSVLSNIAEGFDRNSRAEFARFVSIARGSAGEVRAQVYLARELGYLTDQEARELLALCGEVTRMLVALRKSLDVAVPRH
jgi:four helix bundle protein